MPKFGVSRSSWWSPWTTAGRSARRGARGPGPGDRSRGRGGRRCDHDFSRRGQALPRSPDRPDPDDPELNGGPSLYRAERLRYTPWKLLHSVEDACDLGVDGACTMVFMGAAVELETLEITAEVAGGRLEDGLPLLVEALPCPAEMIRALRHLIHQDGTMNEAAELLR